MTTMWVLVANCGSAKIFRVKGKGKEITKIEDIDYPNGRLKPGEIATDRPGRTFDSVGTGRHAVGNDEKAHEQEVAIFCRQLADLLKKGKEEKSFDQLAIVAPPKFLGDLRPLLHETVKSCVTYEIDKDLGSVPSEHECIKSLRKYLDLWNE